MIGQHHITLENNINMAQILVKDIFKVGAQFLIYETVLKHKYS